MALTGGTLGKVTFVDKDYGNVLQNYRVGLFSPLNEEVLTKKFIRLILMSDIFQRLVSEKINQSAQPNIGKQNIDDLLILLPPLQEQQRIINKIEEIFTRFDVGVESLQNVKAQLQLYRQAVLKHAFNGKLTEEWRKTHKDTIEPASTLLEQIRQEQKKKGKLQEPTKIDISNLPEIPETWTWTSLSDISRIKMGQSPSGSSYNIQGQGLPLLNGPTEFGIDHPTTVQWTAVPTKICNKEDLLICVRGHTTGRMNWADQKYCIGRGLAAITPTEGIVRRELLFHFLLMKTKEIMHITSGSTFPNLKSSELRSFPFPLAPFSEQKELCNRLDNIFTSVKKLTEGVKKISKQSNLLRISVLKAAFEGKLMPQDPTDEPAEKLLERIRNQKEKTNNQKVSSGRKTSKRNQRRLNGYVK